MRLHLCMPSRCRSIKRIHSALKAVGAQDGARSDSRLLPLSHINLRLVCSRSLTTTIVDDRDDANGGESLVARPDLLRRTPFHRRSFSQSLTYLLDGCHFNPLPS